jgi:hypothetical protein
MAGGWWLVAGNNITGKADEMGVGLSCIRGCE